MGQGFHERRPGSCSAGTGRDAVELTSRPPDQTGRQPWLTAEETPLAGLCSRPDRQQRHRPPQLYSLAVHRQHPPVPVQVSPLQPAPQHPHEQPVRPPRRRNRRDLEPQQCPRDVFVPVTDAGVRPVDDMQRRPARGPPAPPRGPGQPATPVPQQTLPRIKADAPCPEVTPRSQRGFRCRWCRAAKDPSALVAPSMARRWSRADTSCALTPAHPRLLCRRPDFAIPGSSPAERAHGHRNNPIWAPTRDKR